MKKPIPYLPLFTVAILVNALFTILIEPTARAEHDGAAVVSGNGDVNGSGAIDISDSVYLLNWLFLGGPDPFAFVSGGRLPGTGQTQCFDLSGQETPCRSCVGEPRTCLGFREPSLTQEDAMQKRGCPSDASRFTAHGDGTVTDNCTGLQWLEETAATPDDDGDGHPDPVTWCRALEYCQDLVFAGQSDWRLPNVRELQSLADYGRFEPAIAPQFRLRGDPSVEEPDRFYCYWTSTTVVVPFEAELAWVVHFDYGAVLAEDKSIRQFRVRAVRGGARVAGNGDVNGSGAIDVSDPVYLLNWLFAGGPAPLPLAGGGRLPDTGQSQCFDCRGRLQPCTGFVEPVMTQEDAMRNTGCPHDANRFIVHGDGTVTDNCTGLQWLEETAATPDDLIDGNFDGNPDPVNWYRALEFCQDLDFAGHSDWRLPNVRELQSLADYGRLEPAIAPQFRFPGDFRLDDFDWYFYWTSTTRVPPEDSFEPRAWVVGFGGGIVFAARKDRFFRIRAVRGGN